MERKPCRWSRAVMGLVAVMSVQSMTVYGDSLAEYLKTIGYDRMMADSRFSGLTGAGQTIAMIDSGLDIEHPSFSPVATRVLGGVNLGFDSPPSSYPVYYDSFYHGTFTTSVAVGQPFTFDTGDGVLQGRGIAPGANVVPVRITDSEGGLVLDSILDGLTWVKANASAYHIGVVNLSLGSIGAYVDSRQALHDGRGDDEMEQQLAAVIGDLHSMGIAVVAASGNSGDVGLNIPSVLDGVVSVGASTTAGDAVWEHSNRSNQLDLLAPGQEIWGAAAKALRDEYGVGFYDWDRGTSLSAPQVAGTMLLMQELYQDQTGQLLTPDQLLAILQASGTLVNDEVTGLTFRQLNVFGALQGVQAIVPEPATIVWLLVGATVWGGRRK